MEKKGACPHKNQVWNYLLGQPLEGLSKVEMEEHLKICSACTEEYARMKPTISPKIFGPQATPAS